MRALMKSGLDSHLFFRSRRLLPLLLAGLLAACAHPGGPFPSAPPDAPRMEPAPALEAPLPSPTAADAPAELSSALLYDLLLGEIAGQRGALDDALLHLLRAAEQAPDPRLAERALRVAVFARQPQAALLAARRWVALDASNLEARQALAALALRQGLYDEALEQLDYLLSQANAEDPRSFEQLSGLLAREADDAAVLALMGRLVERHADNPHAQLAHARLAAHNQESELALQAAERALELDPSLNQARILRARVQVQMGLPEAALEGLAAAVAQQPADSQLRLAHARLLVELGDVEGARAQFRILARQESDNPEVLFPLALLALEAEQPEDAERYLQHLLQLGSHAQEVHYYLGQLAESRAEYELALDWYSRVEPDAQHWLEVQVRRAHLEGRLERLAEARARLQDLRAREPGTALRLFLEEGVILSRAGQHTEALVLYTRVLQVHPDNDDLLYARALVAERLDRLDITEADLRSILERNPEDVRALNALGYTLADRTERHQEALGYIERAIAQEPDDPAIIDSLGWVHFRLGNLELARQHLQRAYELLRDGEIAAHLGEVLWVMGERDAARRIWEEAQGFDPDNSVLRSTRERLQP
jgi:tetratricopeptide (TPR) repeat protein